MFYVLMIQSKPNFDSEIEMSGESTRTLCLQLCCITIARGIKIENYCSGRLGNGIPGTMCWESPGGRGGTWDDEKEEEG